MPKHFILISKFVITFCILNYKELKTKLEDYTFHILISEVNEWSQEKIINYYLLLIVS